MCNSRGKIGTDSPTVVPSAIPASSILAETLQGWACWECDDESEEGLRSIGKRVGEEDGGTGPPVLAEEEGRIVVVDV